MVQERMVRINGQRYMVTISDEQQTLLAAKAAGRVVVGLLHERGEPALGAAEYLIETLDTADTQYLERIVRRHIGFPWTIAESERLIIREFTMDDIPQVIPDADDGESDAVFYTPDKLAAYIRHQYRFYEYGVWAVVRRSDGVILGKAGITDWDGRCGWETGMAEVPFEWKPGVELGYHIFSPYRKQGYAGEACRMILDEVTRERNCPVYAVTDSANEASIRLLTKLEFGFIGQRYSGAARLRYLYGWNC